jgi:hypothetical protein
MYARWKVKMEEKVNGKQEEIHSEWNSEWNSVSYKQA